MSVESSEEHVSFPDVYRSGMEEEVYKIEERFQDTLPDCSVTGFVFFLGSKLN